MRNNKDIQPDNELISAVKAKNITKVKSLLDKGADHNTKDYGSPIIANAIKNGDKELIQLLLDHGINKGRSGDTYYIEDSKIRKYLNQIEYLDVQVNSNDRLRFRCQHQNHNRSDFFNNMCDYSSATCILNDDKLQNTLKLYTKYSSSQNPDLESIQAILKAGVYINALR